jgi:hypothetical protein
LVKASDESLKQGAYVLDKGELFVHDRGTLEPAELTGKRKDRVLAFLPIRDSFQSVLDAMMSSAGVDNAIETGRSGLRRVAWGAGGNR